MNYLRLLIPWIVFFIRFLASTLKNVKIILNMKSAFFDWDTMPRLVFKASVIATDLLLLLLLWQRSILYIWVDIVLGLGRKLYELAARFMSR